MAEIALSLWVPDSFVAESRQAVAKAAPPDDQPPASDSPAPRGYIGSGRRVGTGANLVGDLASLGSPKITREELVGLWRTSAWVRSGISRIAKIAIQEGWEVVPCPEELDEGEEADPEGKGFLERFFSPDLAGEIVNIRQWVQTASKLFLTCVHLKLFGENSWELVKNGLAEDVDFQIIFGRVVPNIDRRGNFVSLKEAYRQILGRDQQVFAQDEVLRFEIPDVDGRLGVSDLEAIELAATTDLWAQVWNRNTFKNNRTPPSVFNFEKGSRDDDIAKFRAYLDDFYAGAENANKSPITRGLEKISVLAGAWGKDAEFLKGRRQNRDEIFSIIGTSAGIMGDVTDVNRANLLGLIQIVYDMEAKPLQEIIEQTVNAWRRYSLGIEGWKFQFRRPDFENRALEAETSQRLINSGQRTPNQERAKRGEPPYPGGDTYWMPQGMVAVGEPSEADRLAEPPVAQSPEPPAEEPKLASDELVVAELRRWRKLSVRLARDGKPQRPFETAVVPEPLRRTIEMAVMTAGDMAQIGLIFDAAIEALGPKAERSGVSHWPDWQNELLQDREGELDEMMQARREERARQLAGEGTG